MNRFFVVVVVLLAACESPESRTIRVAAGACGMRLALAESRAESVAVLAQWRPQGTGWGVSPATCAWWMAADSVITGGVR